MTQKTPWTIDSDDFRLALAVQKALMPGDLPHCKCGRLTMRNRMCNGMGGDIIFFEELGQDQIAFAIGDIAGHGVGAALVMSMTIGLMRSATALKRRPAQMVEAINELLLNLGRQVNMPITCSLMFGVVDLPTGILLYVNAGHPFPLITNPEDAFCQVLPGTTLLLGVQKGTRPEACHQFRQGDRLVLYTDGLSEAKNSQSLMLGSHHLEKMILAQAHQPTEALIERIFQYVDEYRSSPPEDDETLVVIDFERVSTEPFTS